MDGEQKKLDLCEVKFSIEFSRNARKLTMLVVLYNFQWK